MDGEFGTVGVGDGSDFGGRYGDLVVCTATMLIESGIGFMSVGTPTFADKVDISGGWISCVTSNSSGDNVFLQGAPIILQEGGGEMECRFQIHTPTTSAVFVGYCQTLSSTTPVLPATFSTTTMTYTGTGAMMGLLADSNATTNDFRALMGTGGAAADGSGNGIRANATMTADKNFVARIRWFQDGGGECWLADPGHTDRAGVEILRLVKRWPGTEQGRSAPVSLTSVMFPILALETRSAATKALYVDYFRYRSFRNWAP